MNKNDIAAPRVTKYFGTTLQLSSECERMRNLNLDIFAYLRYLNY